LVEVLVFLISPGFVAPPLVIVRAVFTNPLAVSKAAIVVVAEGVPMVS
jgi:hypothetical protein